MAVTVRAGALSVSVLEQLVPIDAALVKSEDVVAVIAPLPVMPPVDAVRLTALPETGPVTTKVGALTA